MRILYLLFCLLVAALGALFGALNAQMVTVDFHLFSIALPLGQSLLLAALLAALAGGGIVWFCVALPLRRRLRLGERARARELVIGDDVP
ncbi:MAG: hypothetical protein WCZ65_05315 [Lysobacteraceae bacterium]|jgi:uncharacterized integral membrane protein